VSTSAAGLLRAGAALLHDENEIREAAYAISKYTGHNPLAFLKECPNVGAKDFFRTALAESLELLDPAEVRDLGVRLMRGLLQSRLAEAARGIDQAADSFVPTLERRDEMVVHAMRPLITLLEQLQISIGADPIASISCSPDGRSARVKSGGAGSTTDMYFSFLPTERKYRIDSRTRVTVERPGLHEQVFFTMTPEDAADHATQMIGRYMGLRAAYARHSEARAQS